MRGTKTLIVMACVALGSILAMTACDEVQEALDTCLDPCQKVNDCGATPPGGKIPGIDLPETGNGAANCAVNCAQAETRAMNGYSECQLDCLAGAECGNINDCWDTKSALYADKCLEKREGGRPPAVEPPAEAPPEAKEPENDTKTGNGEVDEIIKDPAVQAAVEKGGGGGEPFVVNQGSKPPQLLGEYAVQGNIDDALNARPVGSKINTAVCFKDLQENPAGRAKGWYVTYCEKNVPGEDTAPITGTEDGKFTAFFVFEGAATVLFSGTVVDGKATGVEALVVYAAGVDVWEHSNTDWQNKSLTCSCPL
ncbi:MAG: hypothetical protein HY897_13740 [Deltaproteobacteria bacterium]|nr:hypothetical protein [Deltaproteobacteria bacterium]